MSFGLYLNFFNIGLEGSLQATFTIVVNLNAANTDTVKTDRNQQLPVQKFSKLTK